MFNKKIEYIDDFEMFERKDATMTVKNINRFTKNLNEHY